MITPAYIRTMAAYNGEMNRRLYEPASRLSDAERRADRGAFWGSLHGTLAHILWADNNWMARFAGWPKPPGSLKESPLMIGDFNALRDARYDIDARIKAWAATIGQDWIDQPLTWYSASIQRELTSPRGLLAAHFFNHQTHHRGQAHALLTAAGVKTEDTDLVIVVPEVVA
jgi:uncharacterized damage-inducible protein DinB